MQDEKDPIVRPKSPNNKQACSHACYRFQRRHFLIFDFFFFAIGLATTADEVRSRAAKALAENGTQKDQKRLKEIEKDPTPTFKRLQSFSGYQSETMVIRSVDNFLSYLSEIMQACLRRKPELLKSGEQIRTEDVLRFSSRKDLVEFLMNRKLNELAYGGIGAIDEFLETRTNTPLAASADARDRLSVAIELRNIYTHNRGVVNELFLGRLSNIASEYDFMIGKRYHAEFDQIVLLANNMFDVACELGHRLIKSHPDSDSGQFNRGEVVFGVFVVAGGDRPEVLEFVEEPLDQVA